MSDVQGIKGKARREEDGVEAQLRVEMLQVCWRRTSRDTGTGRNAGSGGGDQRKEVKNAVGGESSWRGTG